MSEGLDEVARRAGVSVATASRALSGRRRVTPELADRVRHVAQEIGYRPNVVAQALRLQQTETIGFVVPQISNPFFPAIVEAVERQLQMTGIDLFLCDSQLDTDIELRRVRALLSRRVDGLLISPVSSTESAAALDEAGRSIPVVQIDRFVEGHPAGWVGLDDEVGVQAVVTHLAARGAGTVVFISGQADSSSGRLRLAAFGKAARRGGLTQSARPMLGAFTRAWGRQAAERLLDGRVLPDAVVCGNDEIAVGVLRALRSAGVIVPQDVLLTGYDDSEVAAIADPPLTTVRQPREEMAVAAVRLLTDRAAAPNRLALAPTLVVRESTGHIGRRH